MIKYTVNQKRKKKKVEIYLVTAHCCNVFSKPFVISLVEAFLNSMSKSIRLQQMDCDDMRQMPRV